jgi:hypothetical protein
MKKILKHSLLLILSALTLLSLDACGWFGWSDAPVDLSKLEGRKLADALLSESDRAMDSLGSYVAEGETSLSMTIDNVPYLTTSTYTTKETGIGTADYRTTTMTETTNFVSGNKQDSVFYKHGYQNGKAYFVTLVDGVYSEICGTLSLEDYVNRVVLGSDSGEASISTGAVTDDYDTATAERLEGGDIKTSYSGFGQKTKDAFKETTEMLEDTYDDILIKDVKLNVLYTSDAKIKEMEIALEFGGVKWVDEEDLPKLSVKINFSSFNEDVQIDLNHEDFTDIGDLLEVYALIDILNAEKQADSGSFYYVAKQTIGIQKSSEYHNTDFYINRKGRLVYKIGATSFVQTYKEGLITLKQNGDTAYGGSTDRIERERIGSLIDAAELSVEKVTSIKKTVNQKETVYELTLAFNDTPAHRNSRKDSYGKHNLTDCVAAIKVTLKDGRLSLYEYNVTAKIYYGTRYENFTYTSTCDINEPKN